MSRVLMSDSAALFQMLEPSFLKRGGWAIARAAKGPDLLEAARHTPPDLILIDSECLGEEPSSFLGALKADPALRAIPVVTIGEAGTAARCRAAGADAAISRPVDPEALVSLLCSLARVAGRQGVRSALRVAAQIDTDAGHMRGRVKDIGPGGLFIALPQPLPIQQEIDVCIRLPIGSERRRIRARGIVVRQVFPDRESHLIPGVGIRFTEVDDASRHLISTFVSESTGDRLSPAPDPAEPVTT